MELEGEEPRPVNLGNPEECSMLDLVQAVAQACGRETTLTYQPIPKDDPKQRCPDISRAKALLDWSPTVTLHEGLERTVSWFQNQT